MLDPLKVHYLLKVVSSFESIRYHYSSQIAVLILICAFLCLEFVQPRKKCFEPLALWKSDGVHISWRQKGNKAFDWVGIALNVISLLSQLDLFNWQWHLSFVFQNGHP